MQTYTLKISGLTLEKAKDLAEGMNSFFCHESLDALLLKLKCIEHG